MRTIWKFDLVLTDEQTIEVPEKSVPIAAQVQGRDLRLWVECDPSSEIEGRSVWIVGTGNPIPEYADAHIDTVQIGQYVWHVYGNVAEWATEWTDEEEEGTT